MQLFIRWVLCIVGLIIFSLGIAITINMQHLGIHPWDVLTVRLFGLYGFSVGTWNIILGVLLITISWIIDKTYIKIGTFINTILVGIFVDFFLSMEILPQAGFIYVDVLVIIIGIVIMGFGGGMYNAGGVGSGPRDGFMLSISDKLLMSIGRIRMITETIVLVIGFIIGGPVFIFTFIFTFIQSPVFQYTYVRFDRFVNQFISERELPNTGTK